MATEPTRTSREITGLNYVSVCDGIGAVHAAWRPLGWHCSWTSEIEPLKG